MKLFSKRVFNAPKALVFVLLSVVLWGPVAAQERVAGLTGLNGGSGSEFVQRPRVRRKQASSKPVSKIKPKINLAYVNDMGRNRWRVNSEQLRCTLSQDLTFFGAGVFEQKAGSAASFRLQSAQNPLAKGTAKLVSAAPVWAPNKASKPLGDVHVAAGAEAITLEARVARQMLAELEQGMALQFHDIAWFDHSQVVKVLLTSAYFRDAYDEYLACLAQLFPFSYEQLTRSSLHFETNAAELGEKSKALLDNVVAYLKTDEEVQRVFVDGHTDDVFDKEYNIALSKKRAFAVTAYLKVAGISAKKIVTRYHGERYPVNKDKSVEARAGNRRVTVRLEKF